MTDAAFVYCLEFPNGKKYVGVSLDPQRRYAEHRNPNTPCGHAFRKHGNPKLQVLVKSSREYCMELEARLTDKWGTVTPGGYNLQRGGTGGSVPCAESREKMRKAQTGKKHAETTLAKMREAHQHRPPVSEETRKRMREAAKKRGMPEAVWRASAAIQAGRPQTEERKQAQSARMKLWWAARKQGGAT